mgnify:CR=1 FL=1
MIAGNDKLEAWQNYIPTLTSYHDQDQEAFRGATPL